MQQYKLLENTYQQITVDIRGIDYIFTIYQSTNSYYWFFDLSTTNEEIIVVGEKLVSGIDLGFKLSIKGIYIANTDGSIKDPNEDGLSDVALYILNKDELNETV